MFTVKELIEILKELDENDYVNVSEKRFLLTVFIPIVIVV